MKYLFCLCIILGFSKAQANWFCEEGSSQRSGATIEACGIGHGCDESAARAEAFKAAESEYKRVCNSSSDCKGHKAVVNPKRTSCEKSLRGYTCWRMLAYEVTEETGEDTTDWSSMIYSHRSKYCKS